MPPRVVAALPRTWFRGWCTKKGFQQEGRCLFGCPLGADAVQHYAACRRIHTFGLQRLRLPDEPGLQRRTVNFPFLGPTGGMPDEELACKAFLVAAAYRMHCGARRGSRLQLQENSSRALGQGVKETVLGHAQSTRILDGLWIQRERNARAPMVLEETELPDGPRRGA